MPLTVLPGQYANGWGGVTATPRDPSMRYATARATPEMVAGAQTATSATPPTAAADWWSQNPYQAPADAPTQMASTPTPQVLTGGGQYPLAAVSGEGFMRPWDTAWNAPSVDEMRNDPAYQFRMGEGEQAIQRSAAARGNLLTGQTLKDLTAWGQGLASEEFDKIYGRRLGEYQQAYNIYNQNTNNQFNRLSSLAGLGQTANSQMLNASNAFGQSAGNNILGAGNAQAAATAGSGGAWGNTLGTIGNIGSDIATRWGRSSPGYVNELPSYGGVPSGIGFGGYDPNDFGVQPPAGYVS